MVLQKKKSKENENDELRFENIKKEAKYYLDKNLKTIEEKEKYGKIKSEYNEKREAVIEAALRKIKKIVNNENEYNIFYNNYFNIKK